MTTDPPRMMQGIWPKKVGEDTVALGDLPDPTEPADPQTGRWTVVGTELVYDDGDDRRSVVSMDNLDCWTDHWDLLVRLIERPDPTVEPWRGLVSELVDEEECRYDHHGYCQTHALVPYPCPHTRARAALIREQESGQ